MIGTAGWAIPRETAYAFPATGSQLERYAAVLPSAEINSSFHRPHRRTTYERWAATTPAAFRFSVKLPKTITHVARLADPDDLLRDFLGQVDGLGGKLAIVLVQLPPSLAYDAGVAAPFFEALRHVLGEAVAIACEPRHATWFEDAADACLVDHRVARVAADPVLVSGGDRPGGWPGLCYHRLHGSPRVYYSSYDSDHLMALAQAIANDRQSGTPTWCIFDNTASGAATANALALRAAT